MTKEELFNNLIVFAINTHSQNSYRNGNVNDIVATFCNLPLKDLTPFWESSSDQTKLLIIKSHESELLTWIKSNG